jgi:hypothetical protein
MSVMIEQIEVSEKIEEVADLDEELSDEALDRAPGCTVCIPSCRIS